MVEMLRKSDETEIARRHWVVMLIARGKRAMVLAGLATSATMILWSASPAGLDTEGRLEAAIYQEVVLGDLKGAAEQYQSVIRSSGSKATVARALYRYARCLEKLERRTEAYNIYIRVEKEYSDQTEAALARTRLANWEYSVSGPANLLFEQGTAGKLPDGWFVPALPQDVDRWAQLRRSGCINHDSCAVVVAPDNAPIRIGNLMQSFNAAAYRGKTVRLGAWLRLEENAPSDRAQMWLGVDRAEDKKGFFDDMSDHPVRSSEWTFSEINARIDADATAIKFGVMSIGRGRVWVDHVSFEVVPDGRH
jgi:tetratricopeptide (TPR) repeat protein